MPIHRNIILTISLTLIPIVGCLAQDKTESVLALMDSEIIFAHGIRAELKKGSKIKHPSHFNGQDISVILLGEATFQVLGGYHLTVEYNEVIIKATSATFSIQKGEGKVEITAVKGEVLVLAYDRQVIVRSFQKVVCDKSKNQIIVIDARIKRT